jgi:hypothetical protein
MATTFLPDLVSRSGVKRIRAVLESGASINEKDAAGRTALFRASRLGKVETVELLLEFRADVNAADLKGEAPLQAASRYGHLDCVRLLVKLGAVVNYCPDSSKTEYSETALCSAVRKRRHDIVTFLLNSGASPNVGSVQMHFPLIKAATICDAQVCRELIMAGAKVDQVDRLGSNALYCAIGWGGSNECPEETRRGCAETVRVLVELGADVNVSGHKMADGTILGRSPLELAQHLGLFEVEHILRTSGAVESSPPSNEEQIESDEEIDMETGEDSVSATIVLSAPRFERRDEELARLIAERTKPALLLNYGWMASPSHWRILESCDRPLTMGRIAYVARGCFNRPPGSELEDGAQVLGESYGEAVARFLSLELIRRLEPIEVVNLVSKIADLTKLAAQNGIIVPRKRRDILASVLAKIAPKQIVEYLGAPEYYLVTEKGVLTIGNRGDWMGKIEARIRSEIVEALLESNLKWALLLALELRSLHRQRRSISPNTIYRSRIILEGEIPPSITYRREEGPLLRAIAAAYEIIGGPDIWQPWRTVAIPFDLEAGALPLSRFGSALISGAESTSWDEGQQDFDG